MTTPAKRSSARFLVLVLLLFIVPMRPAWAYNQYEIAQLVAPVALYSDALLSNILVASTYPLEVQQASVWVGQYGPQQPAMVNSTLASVAWDPSVKALTVVPAVLNLLAANMPWTTALGNAFLAQPQDVYNAIQSLRLSAMNSGMLRSNAQQVVFMSNGAVIIAAADPTYLYVPMYNPATVYSGYNFGPYNGYSSFNNNPYYSAYPNGISYGPPVSIGQLLWMGVLDWQAHRMYFGNGYNYYYRGNLPATNVYYNQVRTRVNRHQGTWQFNHAHRRGLAVPTAAQLRPVQRSMPLPVRPPSFTPGHTAPRPATPVRPVPNQPQLHRPVPNQPQLHRPVPNQPQPNRPAPNQPQPNRPVPNQPQLHRPAPNQPQPNRPVPNQPQLHRPAPNQPQPNRPVPNQPQLHRPAPNQPKPARPVPNQPQPARPAPTQPQLHRPAPTQPQLHRPVPNQPQPNRPVPNQPSGGHSGAPDKHHPSNAKDKGDQ